MQLVEEVWTKSQIMAPLETRYIRLEAFHLTLMLLSAFHSNPHPFISLLGPTKGKRLLPRMLRVLDPKRETLSFTLLVACYSQLDVVRDAYLLDQLQNSPQKREAETQNELFFGTVFNSGMALVRTSPLRFVTGMLGLLLESGNIVALARTRVSI